MGSINYIYFGIYFLIIVVTSASGIFTKAPLHDSKFFFFLYAVGQAALETCLLVFLSHLLQRKARPKLFLVFIGLTFLLLILHILDCLMDKILDLSIWQAISIFVLSETFSNFLLLLDASGIPLWLWMVLFGALASIPLIGVAIYRATEIITQKKPLPFDHIPSAIFCIPFALFLWDISASRIIHPNTYTAFLQSLPWKSTFLQPKNVVMHTGYLSRPPQEEIVTQELIKIEPLASKKPNIYLFVIESFREDFITKENAPNLFEFKNQCVTSNVTLSGANASHPSWFSIFHSQFSFLWNLVQQSGWTIGSPPLHVLKQLGYQIRLYTSAQLSYYGMEELLFGKKTSLLNSYQKFHHTSYLPAAETDLQALKALQTDLSTHPSLQEGQLFLIFWDATHFDYSWPKTWTPKFIPFANEMAYFSAFPSKKQIQKIQNRYRNAIHYVDHMFGDFLQKLPNQEDAIIIVTGDHGEEFFEHGNLFHGSHLVKEQTSIPLFMKFGSKTTENQKLITQMDIFPSIIDYLSEKKIPFLQGKSVFQKTDKPYGLISRFNAGKTPYEFCIHNGENKMIARFANERNILESKQIKIISLQSSDDKNLPDSHLDVQAWVKKEFGFAINPLFNMQQIQSLETLKNE
jgi:glucan phosphoethanolaminetransferase (alkaline phosphatase superfamily)